MSGLEGEAVKLIGELGISPAMVLDSLGKPDGEFGDWICTEEAASKVIAGPVKYAHTAFGSNREMHSWLSHTEFSSGDVVYIRTHDCDDRAVMGELVAQYLFDGNDVAAAVVDGNVRDWKDLQGYPVWARGKTPLGCFNEMASIYPIEQRADTPSVAVCDADGVVFFQPAPIHLLSMRRLALQEQIWMYCLKELGWDLVDTICKREYLEDMSVLDDGLRARWEDLADEIEAHEEG